MADLANKIPGISIPPGFHPERVTRTLFLPDPPTISAGLPVSLGTLDYNLYARPILPQANATINLGDLSYNVFARPFVANNVGSAYRIIKVSSAEYVLISKISTVSKSSIAKISGVSAV